MHDIEKELAAAERQYMIAGSISLGLKLITVSILLIALIFVGSALLDLMRFTHQGSSVKYQDFDALARVNPDVCGWIRLEGTRIDHPVVQGRDNFEYLDKAFDGRTYAGGTLFLDYRNRKDLSDPYSIIHGHFMEGGAMFGDLGKYTRKTFFLEHREGELLTPTYDYKLTVMGVAEVDAYDDKIYYPYYPGGKKIPLAELEKKAKYKRSVGLGKDRLLALSTCSGAMDQSRIVVFCRMERIGRH